VSHFATSGRVAWCRNHLAARKYPAHAGMNCWWVAPGAARYRSPRIVQVLRSTRYSADTRSFGMTINHRLKPHWSIAPAIAAVLTRSSGRAPKGRQRTHAARRDAGVLSDCGIDQLGHVSERCTPWSRFAGSERSLTCVRPSERLVSDSRLSAHLIHRRCSHRELSTHRPTGGADEHERGCELG
jgi:hypothetical protein